MGTRNEARRYPALSWGALCVVCVCGGGERQRERETETDRETYTQRGIETERQRDTETHKEIGEMLQILGYRLCKMCSMIIVTVVAIAAVHVDLHMHAMLGSSFSIWIIIIFFTQVSSLLPFCMCASRGLQRLRRSPEVPAQAGHALCSGVCNCWLQGQCPNSSRNCCGP